MKNTMILRNDLYEVRIIKRVFNGYVFKKYLLGSPFDTLETREVRLDLTEDEAIEIGKEILNKVYKTSKIYKNRAITT